jgi:lipopolysaccharide transport system ATP-binding protein
MASIRLCNVCLDYPLYGGYDFSIKRRLLGRLIKERSTTRTIRAIDNISIEAAAGARVGLFGPTKGRVAIAGTVMPLLGLNAGVNLDFAAADNISLLLRISGQRPTAAIVDEIWAFTELEKRMRHLPLRMFSSGMLMRVLFATATVFPADILLLDEWLSVVDENFSAKAENRLLTLVSMAAIVVIASHDQALLRRSCTEIVYLDHGRVVRQVALDTECQLALREKRA